MPYTPGLVAKEADPSLPQANPPSASSRLDWLRYLTIAILLVVLYYRVAVKLVYDWYTIPDYSHGFLVPFFAAFLIWDKRKVLKATPIKQTWSGKPNHLPAAALRLPHRQPDPASTSCSCPPRRQRHRTAGDETGGRRGL